MIARIEDRIIALAASQHGVVTRAQLLDSGMTPRMVQTRLTRGRLRALHRGVYLLGHLRGELEPERAREMAAVLACGPGAVVSHRSAAFLWELLSRPSAAADRDVDIWVRAGARRRRAGIRAHRPRHLAADEVTRLQGIAVTAPDRTLRDLSTEIASRALNRAVARAERRKLITEAQLATLVARQKGRPGAPVLRAAMGDEGAPVLTRSEAEERFLALVQRGRLAAPESNVVVAGHEVDFLWRPERLAVEVDGFGFHGSRRSFENDRRRDMDLAGAGFHVIRVTWRQIVREPEPTLVRLSQALARRGATSQTLAGRHALAGPAALTGPNLSGPAG